MSINDNGIGPKRRVVGASYGMRDWLAQRVTAVIMVLYTATLVLAFLTGQNFTYEGWAGLFAQQWFKLVTGDPDRCSTTPGSACVTSGWTTCAPSACACSANRHHVWLIGCAVWSIQIIWSV
jgi:succinate dehydrogenase / fumarate reductase membrane anchor subunit